MSSVQITEKRISIMKKMSSFLPQSNLGKRILTAVILLPLVIGMIFLLPNFIFGIVSGLVMLIAFTEWFRLAGFNKRPSFIEFLAFLFMLTLVVVLAATVQFSIDYILTYFDMQVDPEILTAYFYASFSLLLWGLGLLAVVYYPKGTAWYAKGPRALVIGALVLLPTWVSMNQLHYLEPRWLMYTLALVWVADTAAYFAGKKFGKTQLSPLLSPGKTWEGVVGAMLGTFIASLIAYYYLEVKIPFYQWFGLNAIAVLFSIVGDLFESIFKRVHNLKDSGNLLPGHGGIMDRIDSLTAALPVFTAIMLLFGSN